MKKLTVAQIKIERIRKPCKKGVCGWCVSVKGLKNYKGEWLAPAEMRDKKRVTGAWCPFFEQFIKILDEGEDWRETKRLPECLAACKRKKQQRKNPALPEKINCERREL